MVFDLFKARMHHVFASTKRLGNEILRFVENKQDLLEKLGPEAERMKADIGTGNVDTERKDIEAFITDLGTVFEDVFGTEEDIEVALSRVEDELKTDVAMEQEVEKLFAQTPYAQDAKVKEKVIEVHKAIDEVLAKLKLHSGNIFGLSRQAKLGWEGVRARLIDRKIAHDMKERQAARKVRRDAKLDRADEEQIENHLEKVTAMFKKSIQTKKGDDRKKLMAALTDLVKVLTHLKENLLDMFASMYMLYLMAISDEFKMVKRIGWCKQFLDYLGHKGYPTAVKAELDKKVDNLRQHVTTLKRVGKRVSRKTRRAGKGIKAKQVVK